MAIQRCSLLVATVVLVACSDLQPEVGVPEGSTSSSMTTSGGAPSSSMTSLPATGPVTDDGVNDDTGDGSDDGSDETPVGVCGDGMVDAGEGCDDGNVDAADGCDAACAVEPGWSCNEVQPSECVGVCGDGMIVGDEECDSDVPADTCIAEGFDRGAATCDATTCVVDLSDCVFVESLQNDVGSCDAWEIGCSNNDGTFGNPQDALECYTTGLTPPIRVTTLEYLLDGANVPLPDALDLVVHAWSGPGAGPGALIESIPLPPGDIVGGGHTFVLPAAIEVDASTFCVGFHGEAANDGFRISCTDGVGSGGASYLRSPASGCEHFDFTPISDIVETDGNFCIRPTVVSNLR